MKKTSILKRGLAALLSLVMVMGLSLPALADSAGTVTGFAALDADIATQYLDYGADEGDVVLPDKLAADTQVGGAASTASFDVTWTPDVAFDGSVAGAVYTYTPTPVLGDFALAAGLVLPTITVTIGDAPAADPIVVESITPPAVTTLEVSAATPYGSVQKQLPTVVAAQVRLPADPGTPVTQNLPLTWDNTAGDYDNTKPGTYTFTARFAQENLDVDPDISMPTVAVTVLPQRAPTLINDPSVKNVKITVNTDGNAVEYTDPSDQIVIDFTNPDTKYIAMDMAGSFAIVDEIAIVDGDWAYFAWLPDFPINWADFPDIVLYTDPAETDGVAYKLATIRVGELNTTQGDPHEGMRPITITYHEGAVKLDNVTGQFTMNFSLERTLAEQKEKVYDFELGDESYEVVVDLPKVETADNSIWKALVKTYRSDGVTQTEAESKGSFDVLQWGVNFNLALDPAFPGILEDEVTTPTLHGFSQRTLDNLVVYAGTSMENLVELTKGTHYTATFNPDASGRLVVTLTEAGKAAYPPGSYAYRAIIETVLKDGATRGSKHIFKNRAATPYGDDYSVVHEASGERTVWNSDLKGGDLKLSYKLPDGHADEGKYYVDWTLQINRHGDKMGTGVDITEVLGDGTSDAGHKFSSSYKLTDSIVAYQLYEVYPGTTTRITGTNLITSGNFASMIDLTDDYSMTIKGLDLEGKAYVMHLYTIVTNNQKAATGIKNTFSYKDRSREGTVRLNNETNTAVGLTKSTDGKDIAYDAADNSRGTIGWKVELNPRNNTLTDVVFEDVFGQTAYSGKDEATLPEPGLPAGVSLQLVAPLASNFTVTKVASPADADKNVPLAYGVDYTVEPRVAGDTDFKTGFRLVLKDTAKAKLGFDETNNTFYKLQIQYTTRFTLAKDAAIGAVESYTFNNWVRANYKKNGTAEKQDANHTRPVGNDSLMTANGTKKGEIKVDGEGAVRIDWTVRFNTNKAANLGAGISIQDPIPEDQKLLLTGGDLAKSVTVTRMDDPGNPLDPTSHYTIRALEGRQGFVVLFDRGLAAQEYQITFSTEPVGTVKQVYENIAYVCAGGAVKKELPGFATIHTESEYFGKSGFEAGKGYLGWTLTVNEEYDLDILGLGQALKNIVITDTLSAGQMFIQEEGYRLSVRLTTGSESDPAARTLTPWDEEDPDADWDYRLDVVENTDITNTDPTKETTTLTLTFNEKFSLAKDQRLDVTYFSKIDLDTLPDEYKMAGNRAKIFNNARLTGSNVVLYAEEGTTTSAQGGTGSGRGDKFPVRVVKVDAANQRPLDGAQFSLYNSSKQWLADFSTANGGVANLSLTGGTYYVKEIVPPSGYDLSRRNEQELVVGRASTLTNGAIQLTFENPAITYTLQVQKYNTLDPSERLAGAVFDLYSDSTKIRSIRTNGGGVASFAGLAPGTYRLVETQAPEGYDLPADPTLTVTVNGNNTTGRVRVVQVGNSPTVIPPTDPPTPPVPPVPPVAPLIVVPNVVDPAEGDAEGTAPVGGVVVNPPQGGGDGGGTTAEPEPQTPTTEEATLGGIPLGGLDSVAWSLLNLIMSIIALFASVTLFVTLFKRRKVNNTHRAEENREEEQEEKMQRNRLFVLRMPAILAGLIPGILFLVLENIRLPLTWITRWTPLIGAFFIISMILVLIHFVVKKRAGDRDEEEEEEEDYGHGSRQYI